MNQHIELVKKYLADLKSVGAEELRLSADAAYATAGDTAHAADAAAYLAVVSAASVDGDDTNGGVYGAKHWLERYEELTK